MTIITAAAEVGTKVCRVLAYGLRLSVEPSCGFCVTRQSRCGICHIPTKAGNRIQFMLAWRNRDELKLIVGYRPTVMR